jgi:UDP-glucose 4-epimerase
MDGHIYRPSSIYGFSREAGRSGLINTLIKNAKSHSVSRIFGSLDTVRDYVLVTDIAEFIARRIIQAETHSQTFILASGRPASVT